MMGSVGTLGSLLLLLLLRVAVIGCALIASNHAFNRVYESMICIYRQY